MTSRMIKTTLMKDIIQINSFVVASMLSICIMAEIIGISAISKSVVMCDDQYGVNVFNIMCMIGNIVSIAILVASRRSTYCVTGVLGSIVALISIAKGFVATLIFPHFFVSEDMYQNRYCLVENDSQFILVNVRLEMLAGLVGFISLILISVTLLRLDRYSINRPNSIATESRTVEGHIITSSHDGSYYVSNNVSIESSYKFRFASLVVGMALIGIGAEHITFYIDDKGLVGETNETNSTMDYLTDMTNSVGVSAMANLISGLLVLIFMTTDRLITRYASTIVVGLCVLSKGWEIYIYYMFRYLNVYISVNDTNKMFNIYSTIEYDIFNCLQIIPATFLFIDCLTIYSVYIREKSHKHNKMNNFVVKIDNYSGDLTAPLSPITEVSETDTTTTDDQSVVSA